ncbi:hypothetical protein BBP40_006589 [Aspergillus hancockii]|nr:hypothetical protein BBP40_006589 [Aspergillus hancockii]
MLKQAARVLSSHKDKTLDIYSTFVRTYIDQHVKDFDCVLPLTNMKCGADKCAHEIYPSMSILAPTQVTSAFAALSSHRDKWNNIAELRKNVRSGVWLEQAVVPYVGLYPEEGSLPLDAYLLDFFKHGNTHALEKDNMIRKGDIYGEAHEEEMDLGFKYVIPKPNNLPKQGKQQNKGYSKQPSSSLTKAKKLNVAESWEDEEEAILEALVDIRSDSKKKGSGEGM